MANLQEIRNALKHHFGFDGFKDNQEAIISSLLDGNDIFVLMPTGGGKSLCYQLPALMMEGTAIVISPLIALMKNQVDALCNYSESDCIAHFLNSSLSRSAAERVKRNVREGHTKLLYMAPESIAKEENIEFLRSINVSFYAIDEAHCISEWGHDFRVEYRNIRPMINRICPRPVIALTATATPKVQYDIQKNLGIRNAKVFKSSFNRPNLYYEVRPKTKDVDRDIVRFIKSNPGKSGIIYCLSRKKVEEMTEMLAVNDIRALAYHAGMDSALRAANQDSFILEEVDIIVATIAFGMGIDKPDVRFVIHYDMPKSLEGYYQETGRAGRDGGEGRCITFFSPKDIQKLDKLLQSKNPQDQEIGRQLLAESESYAESAVCRRKTLLNYFGEQYEEENCASCDNCLHPRKKIEASEELGAVLECVMELEGNVRSDYIVNVLVGRKTDEIKSYGHQYLETFGIIDTAQERNVRYVVRQAVVAGFLKRGIDNYNMVNITEKGQQWLKNPGKFYIVEDYDFSETDSDPVAKGGGGSAVDQELYGILSGLRKDIARKHSLPPYVVFQDISLETMATMYPVTMDELANIPGVGIGKANRYGKEFVDIIKRYVEENEIERPEDTRVRIIPKRNNLRQFLVQGIDRKGNLEDLARSRDIEFGELLTELETFVLNGSKLNIDYYLESILDDDQIEDIIDYFMESEEDCLEEAIQDLCAEGYSEEEVRLCRIKFLSENGN